MEENPNKMFQRGLILKYDDPIEIVTCIGNVHYKLKLLERLKLYPTFHVSFLNGKENKHRNRERPFVGN